MPRIRQFGNEYQAYVSRSHPKGYPPASDESSSASATPTALRRAVTVPAKPEDRKARIVWLETAVAPATTAKTATAAAVAVCTSKSLREHAPPVLAEGGPTVLLRLAESVVGQWCCPAKDDGAVAWPYYWVQVGDKDGPVPPGTAPVGPTTEPGGARTPPVHGPERKSDAGAEAGDGDIDADADEDGTGVEEEPGAGAVGTAGDTTDPSSLPSKPEPTRSGAVKRKTSGMDDDGDDGDPDVAPPKGKRARGKAIATGLEPDPALELAILPYVFASPFLEPSVVRRRIRLLRSHRVTSLDQDDLDLVRKLAKSPAWLRAICASGLAPARPDAKARGAERLHILPAYLYRLPVACLLCAAAGQRGCLVAQTGPLQWRRDMRPLSPSPSARSSAQEAELHPVVEMHCLRSAVLVTTPTRPPWIIPSSRLNNAVLGRHGVAEDDDDAAKDPSPTFLVHRLFARLNFSDDDDDDGDDTRDDTADDVLVSGICLDPAYTELQHSAHPALVARLYRWYPHQSRANFLQTWQQLGPQLALWAPLFGVAPWTDRPASDVRPLTARGEPAASALAWKDLCDRFASFGRKCRSDSPLPQGSHLLVPFRLHVDLDMEPVATVRALLASEVAPTVGGRKSDYHAFLPEGEYYLSQLALLAMQSWSKALAAGWIRRDPSAQPCLRLRPYVPAGAPPAPGAAVAAGAGGSTDSNAWLKAFETHLEAQYTAKRTEPLFFLGILHYDYHWVAWQICHKVRMAFMYDGNANYTDTDRVSRWLKPITDVIDRCFPTTTPVPVAAIITAPEVNPWSYQNRPLARQLVDGMCGPWTSHIIGLCLRHAQSLQEGALSQQLDRTLNTAFWTKDNTDAIRLAQATALLDNLEDGARVAHLVWTGKSWTFAPSVGSARPVQRLYAPEPAPAPT